MKGNSRRDVNLIEHDVAWPLDSLSLFLSLADKEDLNKLINYVNSGFKI